MEFGSAIQNLADKTILITGATGFLSKVLVEKILRDQPYVKKLLLLIRAKDNKTVHQRLNDEVISKDVFRKLRKIKGDNFDSFISEKVTPVFGDTSLDNLGVEDSDSRREMWKEIDVIIHGAGVTRFDERYDSALDINTFGVKNVVNFARKCSKLQILVHVSTAYVCRVETIGLVRETEMKMGEALNGTHGLDLNAERRLAKRTLDDLKVKGVSEKKIRATMRKLGQQRAKFYGWPNTYVFTKAMGEMLIGELKDELPVVIIRPTMICSTFKEPFPGWIEGFGHIVLVCLLFGKGYISFLHADCEASADFIPVDMVVNSMIAAIVAHANHEPSLTVYHVSTSLRNNPISGEMLIDLHYKYFCKNPRINEQGITIKYPNPNRRTTKSKIIFLLLLALKFLWLMALFIVDTLSCKYFRLNYYQVGVQLKANMKVSEVFRPYLFFKGVFDDRNTENLRAAMMKSGMNEDALNFDPICIDWEDYLLNNHIPGVVKYIF